MGALLLLVAFAIFWNRHGVEIKNKISNEKGRRYEKKKAKEKKDYESRIMFQSPNYLVVKSEDEE